MPKRSAVTFVCQQCGASFPKWSGRCSNCQSWNSLVEQVAPTLGSNMSPKASVLKPENLSAASKTAGLRLRTDIKDLDIVLGGGIVPGSSVLLAGQPGAGKSTLLLQLADQLSVKNRVLYVSGEESASQIASRAKRLGLNTDKLLLATSNSTDDLASTIIDGDYDLIIVDSIQTMKVASVDTAPGSVSQITNSAHMLISSAKQTKSALLLVGHITKEGFIAGPKVLEHLVDVVLQIETESLGLRIIRALKNRYGPTTELAVFEMEEDGLKPLINPSAFLLSERTLVDGSVVLATLDGTRPLLIEVQALVSKTSFGYPKRTAVGFDLNRLNVLVAVLLRRTKLNLNDQDIYVNVVGGLRLKDPGADLAVAMAIASAATGYQIDSGAVVFGEIGLGGEIRSVPQPDRRVAEAKNMGFTFAIGPRTTLKSSDKKFIHPTKDIRQALVTYLSQGKTNTLKINR